MRFLTFIFLLTFSCISNADAFRDWESKASNKKITAKVIDVHEGKAHLVLKTNKKGYWVKVDDLSKLDQDYLKSWVNHEDRMRIVSSDPFGGISVIIMHSVEGQTLKMRSRVGDKNEKVIQIPPMSKTKPSTTIRLSNVDIKTLDIRLFSLEGSLITSSSLLPD
jgi:hypothetical protein